MTTIAQALALGQQRLSFVENPSLESQILLSHVLQCERSFFYTWPEKILSEQHFEQFSHLVQRREKHEPIAYLVGQKEFWSATFKVTPSTLIPRSETELLVEKMLECLPEGPLELVDLGTGSGIIACTLALLRPQWHIYAVDICLEALAIAQHNAAHLKLGNISFVHSTWLEALKGKRFAAVVSNPPYLKEDDSHLRQGDLPYEPRSALVAGPNGLEAFQAIIAQVGGYLLPEGYLAFEHGFEQGKAVSDLMTTAHFASVKTYCDLAGCERVTIGKYTHSR